MNIPRRGRSGSSSDPSSSVEFTPDLRGHMFCDVLHRVCMSLRTIPLVVATFATIPALWLHPVQQKNWQEGEIQQRLRDQAEEVEHFASRTERIPLASFVAIVVAVSPAAEQKGEP